MGKSAWPYRSTAKARGLVLLALGIVKVATAEQLRQLVLPGTADVQTVRNACKDLRSVGLVESVGRTSQMSAAGRPVWRDLWNLTTAGLASAASEVGRPVKEMGGTARDAAKAGAPHALAVTNTIDAFRQSPPLPTKPVARRTAPTTAPAPEQVRPLPTRPPGLGHLRGWETEVPLPVSGTFTTPARGSLRADAVLTAPEDGVPVMFVEVDNHTEPAAVVARKVENYRRFFPRTVNDHQGVDVPFWSTRWDDSPRDGYPPLALVVAKNVSPDTARNRMKSIHDLSTPCWQGRRHSGSAYDRASRDGYRDYARTIPVLATTLTRLQLHGPHGPVWWRFGHPAFDTLGHPTFESLEQALDNPDDSRAYHAREEQRRLQHHAQAERERQEEEEAERRRKAAGWPCPTCGREVLPEDVWETTPPGGSDCSICTNIRRREQEDAAARVVEEEVGREEARRNGLFGFLR
ncbi:replication-relaxation family protein [Streptomyces sp. NBC_01341]|uniref:replication-relaxation family protein n=1 Tax=Streptomyces sp. NBC_01341 TaxID=2903831 RepID=UPI002E0F5306|nr:replication-relaxation family protein [Streptomyces sp. NBC_01341]